MQKLDLHILLNLELSLRYPHINRLSATKQRYRPAQIAQRPNAVQGKIGNAQNAIGAKTVEVARLDEATDQPIVNRFDLSSFPDEEAMLTAISEELPEINATIIEDENGDRLLTLTNDSEPDFPVTAIAVEGSVANIAPLAALDSDSPFAPLDPLNDIKTIEGVDDHFAELLGQFGINTLEDVVSRLPDLVEEISGVGPKRSQSWVIQADILVQYAPFTLNGNDAELLAGAFELQSAGDLVEIAQQPESEIRQALEEAIESGKVKVDEGYELSRIMALMKELGG